MPVLWRCPRPSGCRCCGGARVPQDAGAAAGPASLRLPRLPPGPARSPGGRAGAARAGRSRRCRKAAPRRFREERLLYLGREYPKGADYFRSRLKAAFLKNKDETDPEKIKQLIARGEFVIKELEALYFLRKYRAMKQRYYSDDKP
ncbi:electron transfer flavoprotein regulatory factor 1 isoform X1 [Passer domesticus]|uniref:electron transfer flavoprotein regulatory factor 1 isoform X1 n=1 Tax=Passer domesticus TaxID=48849 RepID=UPI0030FEEB49